MICLDKAETAGARHFCNQEDLTKASSSSPAASSVGCSQFQQPEHRNIMAAGGKDLDSV